MRMIVNKLPWILAVANAAFTCWMFWVSHVDPAQYGMAPVLVFIVDFPATFVGELITSGLESLFGETYSMLPYFIVFVIVGFAWYFLIGCGLRRLIRSRAGAGTRANGTGVNAMHDTSGRGQERMKPGM